MKHERQSTAPRRMSFKQLVMRRFPAAVWDKVQGCVVYGSGMDKSAKSWKTAYRRMQRDAGR